MSRDELQTADPYLLLTCEHAGREVPAAYRSLFREADAVLKSHRGYDIGVHGVALRMAAQLAVPIVFSTVTRLLIDLNRSPDHAELFSEYSRSLPEQDRQRVVDAYYHPYRNNVTNTVAAVIASGRRAIHIGMHSCTDELHGQTRDLDIALLFDHDRPNEQLFCERWREALIQQDNKLRYVFNQPYRGSDDGLTTTLRTRFAPDAYLGIEVELRQGMITNPSEQHAAGDLLASTLSTVLDAPRRQ